MAKIFYDRIDFERTRAALYSSLYVFFKTEDEDELIDMWGCALSYIHDLGRCRLKDLGLSAKVREADEKIKQIEKQSCGGQVPETDPGKEE